MKKLFSVFSCVGILTVSMLAQAPSVGNTPSNGGMSSQFRNGHNSKQWANLTDEQRQQIRALDQKQMQERHECKANPGDANCNNLFTRQHSERQQLAQSLGLRRLPPPRFGRHNNRRGHTGPGYGRPARFNYF